MLFLCHNTYTDPKLFFLLPVSLFHLPHALWCVFSLSFSRYYVIHFAPFTPLTQLDINCTNTCMPTILFFHLTHFIGIWILLWCSARCSGLWFSFGFFHVKLIRILPALDLITQLLLDLMFSQQSVLRLRLVEIQTDVSEEQSASAEIRLLLQVEAAKSPKYL